MEHELRSKLKEEVGLDLQTIATDTTTNGNILDSSGFESLTYVLVVGARTDGTYTLAAQDGDDSGLSDAAAVDADNVRGTYPAISAAQTTGRVGIVSKKRYQRPQVVSTSTTAGATVGVLAIFGNPHNMPTA